MVEPCWPSPRIVQIKLPLSPDLLHATLDAYEGDTRVFCRSWDRRLPRRLV